MKDQFLSGQRCGEVMDSKYFKVIILAAILDGEIQSEEIEMINHIRNTHPLMKDIPEKKARSAIDDIYSKLSAGMETKHILEQLHHEFSEEERHSAYALAKEICASDFKLVSAEMRFLTEIEEIWNIPEEIKTVIQKSISLRYLI